MPQAAQRVKPETPKPDGWRAGRSVPIGAAAEAITGRPAAKPKRGGRASRIGYPLGYVPGPLQGLLRAAHVAPRVGGRSPSGHFWSGHMPADTAWKFEYIDLADAGSTWAALVFDCDNREAMANGLGDLPQPNWVTVTERGGHVAYCLKVPVAKHDQARAGPEQYLARVSEYYQHALQADTAFNGMGRNPVHIDAHTRHFAPEPYALDDLSNVIPFGWKRPRVSVSVIGRNVSMFDSGMKWAGREENSELPVLPALHSINAPIGAEIGTGPLPDWELAAIAKSIERYRARWARDGWHKPGYIESKRGRWQAGRRGQRQGAASGGRGTRQGHCRGQRQRHVATRPGAQARPVTRVG